ncbi:MAG: hypothetical protein JXA69_19615, partial [Phycisphaerae bacterium]|nr:hypothetical protein [Phycisphaerae bacterium]
MRALLQRMEAGGPRGPLPEAVPFELPALDALLPGGGVPNGAMTEILYSAEGFGAVSLALRSARRAAGDRGNLVWIEPVAGRDGLYPPSLVQAGVRAQ